MNSRSRTTALNLLTSSTILSLIALSAWTMGRLHGTGVIRTYATILEEFGKNGVKDYKRVHLVAR